MPLQHIIYNFNDLYQIVSLISIADDTKLSYNVYLSSNKLNHLNIDLQNTTQKTKD